MHLYTIHLRYVVPAIRRSSELQLSLLLDVYRRLTAALLVSLTTGLPALSQVEWEPLNITKSVQSTSPDWEPLPAASTKKEPVIWKSIPDDDAPEAVVWTPLLEAESKDPTESARRTNKLPLPPPPRLQALNRSIAYSDGGVGPDIGWNVPNGFRWSERWFGDASLQGSSRRQKGSDFLSWNNGDGTALLSINLIQSGNWSLGINTSFRSIYQGGQAAGGSTAIGEGVSSGFRIATSIGDMGGIAFGGEQILQWDNKTDTGRNFYLMTSKGWWLGGNKRDFPLLIANGGLGTGRFANQDILSWKNPVRFACIKDFENRTGTYSVDNDLCWSPIGTIAIVFNDYWSMFIEYRSGTAQAATSLNIAGGIPVRLSWGVNFAQKNELLNTNQLTWVFKASMGF